ncbi:MAG: hypothetical protein FWC91_12010 [Defluviitaleaceae bacterium]|nr:hypothetical protein [Defluviitaleaceae bacterium]
MDKPKHTMLKISSMLCIILGILRLLAIWHSAHTLEFAGIDVFSIYLIFLIVASCWQLFAGIITLIYWKELEDVSITSSLMKAAIMVVILDTVFLFMGMFLWFMLLMLAFPVTFVLLGFPASILHVIATSKLNKTAQQRQSEKSKSIGILKVIVISATLLIGSIVLLQIILFSVWYTNLMRPNIPLEEAIPWGTWESKDPPIVLYIHQDYPVRGYFRYPALYKHADGDVKIFVSFIKQPGMIGRYRPHLMNITDIHNNVRSWNSEGDGFQVIDDKLHVTMRGGEGDLIFNRVYDYFPINVDE